MAISSLIRAELLPFEQREIVKNTTWQTIRPNILVEANSSLVSFREIEENFVTIEKNPVGKRLIEKIGACTHQIFIVASQTELTTWRFNQDAGNKGKGSSSLIYFRPFQDVTYISSECEPIESPVFVALFHELIHGYHNAKGKNAKSFHLCNKIVWTSDEEHYTIVGSPPQSNLRNPKITENAFRIANGLQPRFSHHCLQYLERHPGVYSYVKSSKLNSCDVQWSEYALVYWIVILEGEDRPRIQPSLISLAEIPMGELTMMNFDPTECPAYCEFKNCFPALNATVLSVGVYKISQATLDCFLESQ